MKFKKGSNTVSERNCRIIFPSLADTALGTKKDYQNLINEINENFEGNI